MIRITRRIDPYTTYDLDLPSVVFQLEWAGKSGRFQTIGQFFSIKQLREAHRRDWHLRSRRYRGYPAD